MFLIGVEARAQSQSLWSVRVRPLGLVSNVYGLEGAWMSNEGMLKGFFIGPTAHFLGEQNDNRQAAINIAEVGIKFGKLFQSYRENAGYFIMELKQVEMEILKMSKLTQHRIEFQASRKRVENDLPPYKFITLRNQARQTARQFREIEREPLIPVH